MVSTCCGGVSTSKSMGFVLISPGPADELIALLLEDPRRRLVVEMPAEVDEEGDGGDGEDGDVFDVAAIDSLTHEMQRVVDGLLSGIPVAATACSATDPAGEIPAALGFDESEVIDRQQRLGDLPLRGESKCAADLAADPQCGCSRQTALLGDHFDAALTLSLISRSFSGGKKSVCSGWSINRWQSWQRRSRFSSASVSIRSSRCAVSRRVWPCRGADVVSEFGEQHRVHVCAGITE